METPKLCEMCNTNEVQRGWRGMDVCWSCWNWYKLGSPANKYWQKALDGLYSNEFGSGPDFNDLRQWEAWGIKAEVIQALNTLEDLRKRYVAQKEEHENRGSKALTTTP